LGSFFLLLALRLCAEAIEIGSAISAPMQQSETQAARAIQPTDRRLKLKRHRKRPSKLKK
jgi:hypothetical protein